MANVMAHARNMDAVNNGEWRKNIFGYEDLEIFITGLDTGECDKLREDIVAELTALNPDADDLLQRREVKEYIHARLITEKALKRWKNARDGQGKALTLRQLKDLLLIDQPRNPDYATADGKRFNAGMRDLYSALLVEATNVGRNNEAKKAAEKKPPRAGSQASAAKSGKATRKKATKAGRNPAKTTTG